MFIPTHHHLLLDMADSTPTGRAIVQAVCAALRLVSSSDGLLTLSQLLAVKADIGEALAFVDGKIQAERSGVFSKEILICLATHQCFTDDHRVILDVSDWESASGEENEDEDEYTSAENIAGGKRLSLLV